MTDQQRDAREIIADEVFAIVGDAAVGGLKAAPADYAERILAALAAEGYSVERLEQVGAVAPDGSGFRSRVDNFTPADWQRVYRVISPSTREAEK